MSYPNQQNAGSGAIPVEISPYSYTPQGYQQITSLSAATYLTPPTGATVAFISVGGAGVRYRDDGTAPTATVGVPVASGSQLQYSGPLSIVQFIQQAAGAILDISYYS
jgi:hypothetical protein